MLKGPARYIIYKVRTLPVPKNIDLAMLKFDFAMLNIDFEKLRTLKCAHNFYYYSFTMVSMAQMERLLLPQHTP